jgi:hypothetical protein
MGSYSIAPAPLNTKLEVPSQQPASIPVPNPSHQIWQPVVYDPQFQGRPGTEPYYNCGNIPPRAGAKPTIDRQLGQIIGP